MMSAAASSRSQSQGANDVHIALLTGGGDRPYALGLTNALTNLGIRVDFIGSDDLVAPETTENPLVTFLNLRGSQNPMAPLSAKVFRVGRYYVRLLWYVLHSKATVFHILWNGKFEYVDRTLLMLLYRLLGKVVCLTVHNVNAGKRDGTDGFLNRATLRCQYGFADHIFVHTSLMATQLRESFDVAAARITVIPFGLNATTPDTALTRSQARELLGLPLDAPALLFFGNIAPYKGLEYLIEALAFVRDAIPAIRLVIAGRPKGPEDYWTRLEGQIDSLGLSAYIVRRIEYVPDADTEVYFKAADVLALPYTEIFQSGVLFLGYRYGLPAVVSDVGSLREDVVEGVTGFVARPRDSSSLAGAIVRYFTSPLYLELAEQRNRIAAFAAERHSWETVGKLTAQVFRQKLSEAKEHQGRTDENDLGPGRVASPHSPPPRLTGTAGNRPDCVEPPRRP